MTNFCSIENVVHVDTILPTSVILQQDTRGTACRTDVYSGVVPTQGCLVFKMNHY
jgi:hypothetical protein